MNDFENTEGLGSISLILIILGIIISYFFANLSMLEWIIVLILLGFFYIVLISFLFGLRRPKTISKEGNEVKSINRNEVSNLNGDYVGSINTRVYHKKTCRLSRLIKKKYKLNGDSMMFFDRQGYKKCKICLKRH